jgi:hypothetical protein
MHRQIAKRYSVPHHHDQVLHHEVGHFAVEELVPRNGHSRGVHFGVGTLNIKIIDKPKLIWFFLIPKTVLIIRLTRVRSFSEKSSSLMPTTFVFFEPSGRMFGCAHQRLICAIMVVSKQKKEGTQKVNIRAHTYT